MHSKTEIDVIEHFALVCIKRAPIAKILDRLCVKRQSCRLSVFNIRRTQFRLGHPTSKKPSILRLGGMKNAIL